MARVAATIDAVFQPLCRFIVAALSVVDGCSGDTIIDRSQPCQRRGQYRKHDRRPGNGVLKVVVEVGEVETVVERAQQTTPSTVPGRFGRPDRNIAMPKNTPAIDWSIHGLRRRRVRRRRGRRLQDAADRCGETGRGEGGETDPLGVEAGEVGGGRCRRRRTSCDPGSCGRAAANGAGERQRDPDLVRHAEQVAAGDVNEVVLDEAEDRLAIDAVIGEAGEHLGHAERGDEGKDTEVGDEQPVEQAATDPMAKPRTTDQNTDPGVCG